MKKTNTKKQIQITCQGAAEMPVKDMVVIQGDLKDLSPENNQRLRKIMLEHGFAFPACIARIKGKPYGIIDATQRHKVISEMLDEGYKLIDTNGKPTTKLPITFTECKNKKQAGQLILAAISQFGKVTHMGFEAFTKEFNILPSSFGGYDLPNFDISTYIPDNINIDEFFVDTEEKPNQPQTVECPECGHVFEL